MLRLTSYYRQLSRRARASVWFLVCNGLQSGVGFLSLPLFTRLMPADQFGQVALYNSWMAILSVFATLNVQSGVFNNGMVTFRDDRKRYLSSMQGLVSVGSFVVLGVVVIVQLLNGAAFGLSLPMLGAMFAQILASAIFALWAAYERYEYRYHALLWATFAFTAVTTGLSLAAVAFTEDDESKALVRVTVGSITSLAVALVLAIQTQLASRSIVHRQYWAYAIKFNLPLIPHYLSFILLSQIDRIMIASYLGPSEAAMYSVASSVGQALVILVNALAASLAPWTYERLASGAYDGMGRRFWQGTAIVAMASCVVSGLAPGLMRVAAPPVYAPATPVLALVAVSSVFLFVYSAFANIEFFYAATKFVSAASVGAALVKLATNYLVIPEYGIVGAGATTLACYALFALAHTLFTRRLWAKKMPEVAIAVLQMGRTWGVAALGVIVTLILIALFANPLTRVGAAVLFVALCCWKRQAIANALRGGNAPSPTQTEEIS